MKLIGVLWNSIGDKKNEATEYIKQYGDVIYWDVDLKNNYKQFLLDLYPFNETEKWKAQYKIDGLFNKYLDNTIRIMIIDIPQTEKVYLKNKDKMMYKNVLDLKVTLRKKYKHLTMHDNKNVEKTYDNVFHMSDDENEYEKDLIIILKYLSNILERKNGFLVLDDFVDESRCSDEKWGTRNKVWLNKYFMYKENTKNTYESYSEVLNMYLLSECNLEYAYYDLANYKGIDGVITKNVLDDDEFMIDGSHVMSENETYTRKELIEHNNLEMLETIIKNWCNTKGYIYDCKIMNDLHKLFIYDLLTLQPDRNPSNYAIAVNSKTKNIRLVYFDNSNMLFCDNSEII